MHKTVERIVKRGHAANELHIAPLKGLEKKRKKGLMDFSHSFLSISTEGLKGGRRKESKNKEQG